MGASTPPANTGVPGRRPVSFAPSDVTSPTTASEDRIRLGISSSEMPSARAISSDQQCSWMSYKPPRFPAEE